MKKSINKPKKKILVLIGNQLGLVILNFLNQKKGLNLYVCSSNKNLIKNKKIKFIKTKTNFNNFMKKKIKYDFLITIYWPWIIPKNLFSRFVNSINFHPAFLPYGRGWYPHSHAILKKFKWGVSLHKIFAGIDNGDIWCQKEIKISKFENSTTLYNIAKFEITKLFKKNFQKILDGKITPIKQTGKVFSFKKKDIMKYDKLFLDRKYKLIDLIKINNARTFQNKTFNYFIDNGEKYELKINVKKLPIK